MSLRVDIKKRLGAFSLEMAFEAGDETLGLLGASGCGKSVTLRCIAGIETPDEGVIEVNGTVFFDRAAGKGKPSVNLRPQVRKTALLFQNYNLFPNLTVKENVGAGIDKRIDKVARETLIAHELRRFSLEGFEKRYPLQLSGGQQQRVALARMLAADPGILMLDEPFSALDSHLKSVLEQNLVSLFESFEGTILYVSHDVDEALRFCNRIAVVDGGHIMELDTGEELFNNPRSEAAIKLSGCKNITDAQRVNAHEVYLPRWDVLVEVAAEVPTDVRKLGVRAFFIEHAEGPGQNCFVARVDRISDSRYDRTVLLRFLGAERDDGSAELGHGAACGVVHHDAARPDVASAHFNAVASTEIDEMRFLHSHAFWRIDKLSSENARYLGDGLGVGDEVWVRIPPEKVYLVTR